MDKEKKRLKDREYYRQHREEILERVANYQKREKGKIQKYQREYAARKRREDPQWKDKRDARWKEYYRRNIAKRMLYKAAQRDSIKSVAHSIARNALRTGKLVRPQFCDACGKACKPQMHHPDYQKPLNVIWLCGLCHGASHSNPLSR